MAVVSVWFCNNFTVHKAVICSLNKPLQLVYDQARIIDTAGLPFLRPWELISETSRGEFCRESGTNNKFISARHLAYRPSPSGSRFLRPHTFPRAEKRPC